jgi:hypothetical protein
MKLCSILAEDEKRKNLKKNLKRKLADVNPNLEDNYKIV